MATREVEARLKISAVDKTGRVPEQVGKRLQQINRQAAMLNKQQGLLGRTTASTMAVMARYAAPGVVAALTTSAVKDFAAVERQMTRIGITADASAAETESAFRRMQQVSKQMALPLDSAVSAVDTLVSSGLSLKEAMDFLPSVLATAQASGSATEDIANTAIKAASALKIEASEMQRAFDIMVMGGKAGQFELKDMATYIPELANSFASLGYTGEDGLKQLIALLQTIREDTGSASAAATQAQNIFGKMFTEETAKKFSNFGINLRKEMDAAKKSGEDAVSAFVRISKEALDGDLSKLPLLFTDQEFRLGMQSLITSADSYKKFIDAVNSAEVDGTVQRDLKRVIDDTQGSIDKLSASWDQLMKSFGSKASKVVVPVIDSIVNATNKQDAIDRALKDRGMGYLESQWHQVGLSQRDQDLLAIEGGFNDPELRKRYEQGPVLPEDWKPGKDLPVDRRAGPDRMVKGRNGQWYNEVPEVGPIPGASLPTIGLGDKPGRDRMTATMLARRAEIDYFNSEEGQRALKATRYARDGLTDDTFDNFHRRNGLETGGETEPLVDLPRAANAVGRGTRAFAGAAFVSDGGDRRSYADRHAGMEPWTPTRVFEGIKDFFNPQEAEPVGEALAQAAISKLSSDAGAVGTELGSVVREAIMAASPQIGAAIAQAFAAGASQVRIGVNTGGFGGPGGKLANADTGRTMPENIGRSASTGG